MFPKFIDPSYATFLLDMVNKVYFSSCQVLPVEHKMKEPSSFLAWNGLLNVPMTLVLLLYMTVGYYGCLHYGSTVRGSITLSLPSTDKCVALD